KKLGKVAFFYGCVQDAFLSHINSATIRVLQRNGYEVHFPQDQTCCGAAQWHTGDDTHARVLARQNIDAFLGKEFDAIINNAGGCGLTLLEYPDLLHDDPEYSEKAKLFASKVQDFSKFLSENLNEKPAVPIRFRAVYSDSCHLRHGQKVVEHPRALLKSIPGLELIEMSHPDKCCGSAGIYNIMNPEPANAILNEKMSDIALTGANLIVTNNAGCHMQLTAGVRKANIKARVMHIAEVMDIAYRMGAVEELKAIRHPKPIFGYPKGPQKWLAWLDKHRKNGKENGTYSSLKSKLQPGQVINDPVDMITYERDAGIEKGHPSWVAFPYSTKDIQIIMRWISGRKIALTARGAGTGLSGNAVAEHGGLILEFSHMKQVLELDREGHTAVIQPGVITQELDALAKKNGLYYPPDPASGRSSTIGANISLNSGGPHCFKYGVTSNYVLGLNVVLSDGRSVKFGGHALDYPEYDITGLMTGSEGTLGVITEAVLGLRKNPPAVKTMMAEFKTLEDASNAVSAIIKRGLIPATLELMDQRMIHIIKDYMPPGMPVEAGAVLIIETDGYQESVTPQMDEIVAVLDEMNVIERKIAQDEAQREMIWYARKSVAGSLASLATGHYTVDATVPRSRMAEALNQIVRICDEYDLPIGIIAHAGDGNLHPMIMIRDQEDQVFLERVFQAAEKICKVCTGMQGSITGEHGVGNEKNQFMPLMYNHDELEVMHEIKDLFDPQGLLNPGKIFPIEMPPVEIPPQITTIPDSPFAPATTGEAALAIRAWVSQDRQIQIRSSQVFSADPGRKNILATENLNQVIDYQPDDLYITVGAGMKLADLGSRLAKKGFCVPLLSPWEQATLGDIVAANFNAPLRMRYGGLRDLVLALKVVLPDGRVIRLGRPVFKNVAGYDLVKLFIGSYGTLGLITEITLKLTPTPQKLNTLIIPVDDLEDGMRWGKRLFHQALVSTAILLCPGNITSKVDS
ncbi:MAG: FAD-binding protein, partial [Anaerolineaceae bacterium]|nr:FAD-binding protein [Anaerolineaceae bacterium]